MNGATDNGAPTARHGEDLAALNDRLMAKNHALAEALNRAGKELTKAKSQLAQLAQPPMTFAVMVRVDSSRTDELGVRHATAEVIAGTRRLIVPVAANVNAARLTAGRTVLLNEAMTLVDQRDTDTLGTVRTVTDALEDGRLIVADHGGNAVAVRRAGRLAHTDLKPGDRVIVDPSIRLVLDALPREDDADLVLEETPDVTFDDIGGLDGQIDRIRDAVQLPFQHRDLYARYELRAPKGVLLYGPPGNGKTLIAKAVAHALAEGAGSAGAGSAGAGSDATFGTSAGARGVFLSVKGPELLNKYVGESERLIRQIFQRARERAADGSPVIVFIDEMDSLLRTRGSGVSSDVETTIVPQFLTELDGVESIGNVMVIGASNRVDMIDPAVLRPGRLDVKIRIDRPDADAAKAIVRRHLSDALPFAPGLDAETAAALIVDDALAHTETRRLADVRDEQGRWRPLHLADVISGAALKNVVDRAKTLAVKASVAASASGASVASVASVASTVSGASGASGDGTPAAAPAAVPVALDAALLARAVEDEFAETRDSLLDADPVQWSLVNGFDAGSVTAIRDRAAA